MARIALYRKYRPKDLSEFVGQEHIKKTLENSMKKDIFSHAYLFCGPRGTGKTSVARIMAKGVNCQEKKNGTPCNKCSSCVSINEQRAIDVIEIDAASNRGIDEIRDLREKVKFGPSELKYKVFIIDEVHMLTKEAFNALLKTLEEPPEHAIFIMATTEIHKIPATVISRCQRYDFKRIGKKEIEGIIKNIAKKESITISDGAVSLIARVSEGGLRDAISFLDQISMNTKDKEITEKDISEVLGIVDSKNMEDLMGLISSGDKKSSLEFIKNMLDKGADIGQLTKSLMFGYREELKNELKDNGLVKKYIYVLETLGECNRNFKYSLNPQLSLEISVIKIINVLGGDESIESNESDTKKTVKEKTEEENIEEVVDEEVATEKEKKPQKDTSEGDDMSKWRRVLFEVKSKNNSVHAVVRESEPVFHEEEVHLFFPHKFHKERIEDGKNRKIVEDALTKVFKKNYCVKCKMVRGLMKTNKEDSKKETSTEDALNILGGEVVG